MRAALALGGCLVVVVVACGAFEDGKNTPSSVSSTDGGTPSEDASVGTLPDAAADFDAGSGTSAVLVAHFKLDESAGTTVTDSANGNVGTRNGGEWQPGKVEGAFATMGTGCISIPLNAESAVRDRFTVAAWVNLSAKTSGDSFIFTHGSSFYVKLNSRYPQLSMGSGVYYNINRTVAVDEWHHVAVTFDAGIPAIYVDGILGLERENAMPATTRPMPDTDPMWIGCGNGGGSNAVGLIDDVRLYDGVLTLDEIRNLVASP